MGGRIGGTLSDRPVTRDAHPPTNHVWRPWGGGVVGEGPIEHPLLQKPLISGIVARAPPPWRSPPHDPMIPESPLVETPLKKGDWGSSIPDRLLGMAKSLSSMYSVDVMNNEVECCARKRCRMYHRVENSSAHM
ncbi:hypothetical protein SAY86_031008 [Trapa natans]|uniref:Uncharacterized protein n=1 Tax=Trapa natans TaxID=22666 RepID=A0AAN7MGV1_TRANT|nr:hypothetical protein SAY86_031008 [Trapa natans]